MKGLRDALKREKRKDEKAMVDAEKKRNKMKEAMRHLEQRVQMREHLRSHRMPTDAPPERKKAMRMEDNMRPAISAGEHVLVSADFSPNMNRPEGEGFAMVSRGVGGGALCDVQHEKPFGGMMHKNVPLKAITPIPLGLNTDSIAKDRRKRTVAAQAGMDSVDSAGANKRAKSDGSPMETLVGKLLHGMRCRKKDGCLRKEANRATKGKKGLNDEDKSMLFAQGLLLEVHLKSTGGTQHSSRNSSSQKFQSDGRVTIRELCRAWGKGKNGLRDIQNESRKNAIARGTPADQAELAFVTPAPKDSSVRPKSTIDNYKTAEQYFTAKRLYAINKCREAKEDCCDSVSKEADNELLKTYLTEYDTISDDDKQLWELKRREHLARQPYMQNDIVAALSSNPQRSFRGLEQDIGLWCSHKTIERWLKSFDTFTFYKERLVPRLSEAQKAKHLAFAQLVRNFWNIRDENGNLPNGKKRVLLVHYDEKWFWGLVLRAFAKACEEIGVKKRDYAAFHRSHINKVMAIAFVAAVFDGSLESGCEVVKLPLVRAQAPKIAERAQYEAVSQPDGSIRYPNTNPDGTPKEPLRRKGESFLVDCCVTGSNEGTKKDPKCSLLLVFKETIFPAILNLVGPGKQYEDCHDSFTQFVTNFCAEQGWTWQPQAPQMPHTNVLDLSVFLAMSRRHSEWARKMVGTSVISTDQIWDTAEDVYDSMPNCKIASAFIQYWRIMGLVIKAGGSNEFVGRLGDENLHTGIRIDFNETAKGMEPSARHPSNK